MNIRAISFRLFDQDNDGLKDLIYYDYNGVSIRKNIGGTFTNPVIILRLNTMFSNYIPNHQKASQHIEFGDIDGDEKPDILYSLFEPNIQRSGTFFFKGVINKHEIPTSNVDFINFTNNPLIPDNDLNSHQIPELYDIDCDGKLDLFISDPIYISNSSTVFNGRTYYFPNQFLYNGISNLSQLTGSFSGIFGFTDNIGTHNVPQVITRMVDFFNDGCPIAISFHYDISNPTNSVSYYNQFCQCR